MGIAFLKSRFIKSPEHIGNYIEYLEKQNPLFSQFGELELAEALEDALYPSNSIAWVRHLHWRVALQTQSVH